jgi:hypothetical protein
MKKFLIGIGLLFSVAVANAHIQVAPDLTTIAKSDSVYVTRVTASVNGRISFSVNEVLRGAARSSLVLQPYLGGDSFLKNSNWILFRHAGGFKDCVGWAMKGDCEWLPVSATRGAGTAVSGYRFSVDQIRNYLRQHPASP